MGAQKPLTSSFLRITHTYARCLPTGFLRTSETTALRLPSLRNKVSSYRKVLSRDMTQAAHAAAARADSQLDARALAWTLDQLDEEGELVKFAAGIPGFFLSTQVKGPVAILENAPKRSDLHDDLSRHVTSLLIRASKPGLLRGSKLLPESVRQYRTTVCLTALYYLPHAIEKILRRVVENPSKVVLTAFAPILHSEESWLIAEGLSQPKRNIDLGLTIGAQCVATVNASQRPEKHMESILMRHLKIEEPFTTFDDSTLLKNLNQFLKNTALKYINREDINIILSTVHIVKQLKLECAALELQDEFKVLIASIHQHEVGSPKNARINARLLLNELTSLIGPRCQVAGNAGAQGPRFSPSATLSHNAPGNATTPTSASTPQTPQMGQTFSMLRPLQLLRPQRRNDVYISMNSPTSPISPNDTLP